MFFCCGVCGCTWLRACSGTSLEIFVIQTPLECSACQAHPKYLIIKSHFLILFPWSWTHVCLLLHSSCVYARCLLPSHLMSIIPSFGYPPHRPNESSLLSFVFCKLYLIWCLPLYGCYLLATGIVAPAAEIDFGSRCSTSGHQWLCTLDSGKLFYLGMDICTLW